MSAPKEEKPVNDGLIDFGRDSFGVCLVHRFFDVTIDDQNPGIVRRHNL